MLYPAELRGQSLLRALVSLCQGQTRNKWPRLSAESHVEKQYTTPKLESRGKRSLQHSTVEERLGDGLRGLKSVFSQEMFPRQDTP